MNHQTRGGDLPWETRAANWRWCATAGEWLVGDNCTHTEFSASVKLQLSAPKCPFLPCISLQARKKSWRRGVFSEATNKRGEPVKHGKTNPHCACHHCGKILWRVWQWKQNQVFFLQLFYFAPLFEHLGVEGLASPWTYLDVTLHSLDVCYQYQYKRCYLQMFSSSVFLPKELLFVGCAALAGRTPAPMWRRQSVSLIFPNCTQTLIHSCQTFVWFRSTET